MKLFKKMMMAAALFVFVFSFAACEKTGGEAAGPSVIAQYTGTCESGAADIAVNLKLYDKNSEEELPFIYEYGIWNEGVLTTGKYMGTYSINSAAIKTITFSVDADELEMCLGTTDAEMNTITVSLLIESEKINNIILIKTL